MEDALLRGSLRSEGYGKTFSVAGVTATLYFSGHALTPCTVAKHPAENEMGTNIRQLQEGRGVNLFLFGILIFTAKTVGLPGRKRIY